MTNTMTLTLKSHSKNEALARVAVAAFATQLDPLVSELSDIKTAVSEAVTNSIIHGYNLEDGHDIIINASYENNNLYIEIKDTGIGITDINEARTPLYTSKPDMDRSGLGFTVMENFMDTVEVESSEGKGTTIKMIKTIGQL
jgi:stage II sporulation protein AB (anti-sigma F factor)